MFRLIGCLVVLLAAGAAGWYLKGRFSDRSEVASAEGVWTALSRDGSDECERKLESLQGASVPFVRLSAAEVASCLFMRGAGAFPAGAGEVRAAVVGNQLAVRGEVPLAALGGGTVLAPIVSALGDREEMQLTGSFSVLRRGVAGFDVAEVRLGSVKIPGQLIGTVLRALQREERPEGMVAAAIPLLIPEFVIDIRIADSAVLVYRRVEE